MKKGLLNELRNQLNSKAKNVAKGFKRKHKLSGKCLNVNRLLEKNAWQRGTMLIESSACLIVLLILLALMMLFREESFRLYAVMAEMVHICSVFMLLAMHFSALLIAWATIKILWAPFTPVWEFVSGFLF